MRNRNHSRRYYLAYLTANDSPHYQADFLNFRQMTRQHPGVEKVQLYIAISRVQPFSARDHAAVAGLLELAAACPWLDVRTVFWKGNVGRDFSSAAACLTGIAEEAGPDDYVLVRNRSAYGPSRAGWYAEYTAQHARFPNTGLVGSTINLVGHPKRPLPGPATHVQTYAYLGQWRHLQPLLEAYPGARCVDRLELINEGELGLSRAMLERGLGLSCLHWPNKLFTAASVDAPELPRADIKRGARKLALRYKYPGYFVRPQHVPAQLAWSAWLTARASLMRVASTVPQIELGQYG